MRVARTLASTAAAVLAAAIPVGAASATPAPVNRAGATSAIPAPVNHPGAAWNTPAPVNRTDAVWTTSVKVTNTANGRNKGKADFDVRYSTAPNLTARTRAVANASCVGCRTVALAFQVGIMASPNPSSVTLDSQATAVSQQCTKCTTYAAASQFLLVTDKRVTITPKGRATLNRSAVELRRLAASSASAADLDAAVTRLGAQVSDVLAKETRTARRHGVLKIAYRLGDRGHLRNVVAEVPVG